VRGGAPPQPESLTPASSGLNRMEPTSPSSRRQMRPVLLIFLIGGPIIQRLLDQQFEIKSLYFNFTNPSQI
jgi:hypothetical protein